MEHSSINPQEVKKFTELANEWWKPNGKFKTLHKFNPVSYTHLRAHET